MKCIEILVHCKINNEWRKIPLLMGRFKKETNCIINFLSNRKDINCVRLASHPQGYCFIGHSGKVVEFNKEAKL